MACSTLDDSAFNKQTGELIYSYIIIHIYIYYYVIIIMPIWLDFILYSNFTNIIAWLRTFTTIIDIYNTIPPKSDKMSNFEHQLG